MGLVTSFVDAVLRRYLRGLDATPPSRPVSLIVVDDSEYDDKTLVATVKLHLGEPPDVTDVFFLLDELLEGSSFLNRIEWTPQGILFGLQLRSKRRQVQLLLMEDLDEELMDLRDHKRNCAVCEVRRSGSLESAMGRDAELKGLFLDFILVGEGLALPREEINSWTPLQQQAVYDYAISENGETPEVLCRYLGKDRC
jgi:hypothetical protein